MQILCRLLLFGFPSDAKSIEPVPAVGLCVPALLQAAQALLDLRSRAAVPKSQALAMLQRGVVKIVKTLGKVQECHPW